MPRPGRDSGTERKIFSEIEILQRRDGPESVTARMVRQGSWKHNYYHDAKDELFNLDEDPHERINRANDPQCAEILGNLRAAALEDWNPAACAAEHAAAYRRSVLVRKAPSDPKVTANEYWAGPDRFGYVSPV